MKALMLRHSAGFEHTYLPDAEVALKQLGQKHDWEIRTTHRLDKVTPEVLEDLDLLIFTTTGNLAFTGEQKEAILAFVKGGKGFLGIHNATDTCYDWPEYAEMLGGWFKRSPVASGGGCYRGGWRSSSHAYAGRSVHGRG